MLTEAVVVTASVLTELVWPVLADAVLTRVVSWVDEVVVSASVVTWLEGMELLLASALVISVDAAMLDTWLLAASEVCTELAPTVLVMPSLVISVLAA